MSDYLQMDEYGCPISTYFVIPDPYIIRGYPKNGWRQGETWAIIEAEDGFYVESHWRAMWKGGDKSYSICFSTDAKAEKWIIAHVKSEEKKKIRKEKEKDLKEAKKLIKKWK